MKNLINPLKKPFVKISDLSSRSNFECFLNKLKTIDQRFIREIRFKDLRHQFLITQWKEIELLIREWPVISMKFEGTRLDFEHIKILSYFLHNKSSKIEKLSFNFIGFTSENAEFLFRNIPVSHMKKLRRLTIKNNKKFYDYSSEFLEKFNEELSQKTQKNLGFFYKIAENIASKKYNFFELDLSHSQIDDKKLKKLVFGLQENHSSNDIRSLNLSFNEKISENGWFLFTEKYLKTTIGLEILRVSQMNFEDSGFKRLCEGISSNESLNLKSLDLSNNANISSKGWFFFVKKVLLKVKSLETLLLRKCGINDEIIEGFVEGMVINDENVNKSDNFSKNQEKNVKNIKKSYNLSISESFYLKERKILIKSLDLSQNWNISEKGWFKLLSPFFAIASELEEIIMKDCVLNENKLKSISETVFMRNLTRIDVGTNPSITEIAGWPIFADFLKTNKKIENLNMCDCNINTEKLKVIFGGLEIAINLQEIDLSNNLYIKDRDFGGFIGKIGEKFGNLKVLRLRKMGINDEKIGFIISEMEKSGENQKKNEKNHQEIHEKISWFKKLEILDISENPDISEGGIRRFSNEFLRRTEALEELLLEEMGLNDKKIKNLMDFLKKNQLRFLKKLSFSRNKDLSEKSFEEIAFFVKNSQEFSPKKLDFSLNFANCSVSSKKIQCFLSCFSPNAKIVMNSLDFSKNSEISNEGFLSLKSAFLDEKLKISRILLKNCKLNAKKLKGISFVKSGIEFLDLSENSKICSEEFFEFLSGFHKLKAFKMGDCGLKDEDFKRISLILYNSASRFEELDFGGNKGISANSYKAFFKAFFAEEKALNISAWEPKNLGFHEKSKNFLENREKNHKFRGKNAEEKNFSDEKKNGIFFDEKIKDKNVNFLEVENFRTSVNTPINDLKFKTICSSLTKETSQLIFETRVLDLSKNRLSAEIWQEFVIKVLFQSNFLQTLILDDFLFNDQKMASFTGFLTGFSHGKLNNISLKGNKEISESSWLDFFEKIAYLPINSLSLDNCGFDDKKIEGICGLFRKIIEKTHVLQENLFFLSFGQNKRISIEKLSFFSEFLAFFPNLKSLILSENELNDDKIKAISPLINKNSKLENLDLSGKNTIKDFVFNDFMMNLRKLPSFLSLKLGNFGLNEGKFSHLSKTFKFFLKKNRNNSEFSLDLSGNKGLSAISFVNFADKTLNLKGISMLKLANCGLTDEILEEILNFLEKNHRETSIKDLDLSENRDISRSFSLFFSKIHDIFPELTIFSLRNCDLSFEKLEFMIKGLKTSQKSLKIRIFDISENKFLDEKSWVLISEFLLYFMRNSLEKLNISACELQNSGFLALLQGLISHRITSISSLNISKNWAITDSAFCELFQRLISSADFTIKELNLSECTINDNKIKALAENSDLLINSSLNSLDFSMNKSLSENGWRIFSEKLLFSLKNLKKIDVFSCDFDSDAKISHVLRVFIEEKRELDHLSLSVNSLNLHEGLMFLQQSLHQTKVKSLKLRFQNEELLLKMFWSPLDFFEVLNRFCIKTADGQIKSRKFIEKTQRNDEKTKGKITEKNKEKIDKNHEKKALKTLIFEPKSFLPFFFSNPTLCKYEDILLNEAFSLYLLQNRLRLSLKKLLLISYDHTANDSLLSRNEINRIKTSFSSSNLDQIFIDYTYNYTKFNNNEAEMLNFIRLFPPKAFIIKEDELNLPLSPQKPRKSSLFLPISKPNQHKITLNGLKALFAILYQNYNINEIKIDYDYDSMLNQGIAFSLREKLYQTFPLNRLTKLLKYLAYKLLSLFVLTAKHYKFSSDIIKLNDYLKAQRVLYMILMFFIAIYYFTAIFLPFYFIKACGEGLAWSSHYIFTGFVISSLLFEGLLFMLIYGKIRPVYLAYNNYATNQQKTFKSKFKRRGILVFYMFLSQLAHYDLYSKFSFIRITFECQQNSLGIVASIFMGIHCFIGLYHYLMMIFNAFCKENRELNFKQINKFLMASHLCDFAAFNNTLDVVAPYNIVRIPNIWIIRGIAPKLSGLSINSKIFFFFLKFLLKNTPNVIIQIMFLFFRIDHFGESDLLVIGALALSLVTFLLDFYKFISVRPSTIYQGDFDELIRRNKKKRMDWIKEEIEERDRVLDHL